MIDKLQILVWLFIIILVFSFVQRIINQKNYEGISAQEWADEYYELDQKFTSFRNCVEEYVNLDSSEKVHKTLTDKSLTGYTPKQIYQGYMEAINAGDTSAASQLKEMYEDEIEFRTEVDIISVFDYCD